MDNVTITAAEYAELQAALALVQTMEQQAALAAQQAAIEKRKQSCLASLASARKAATPEQRIAEPNKETR